MKTRDKPKIAIIGLGYVGLPLAVAFAEKYPVMGFDIKKERIEELKEGVDSTLEVSSENLQAVLTASPQSDKGLLLSHNTQDLADSNIYIITVPTPIDKHNKPVLTPMLKASEVVGGLLKKGDIVIYESTVYPGVTEDECVPVLEEGSGLKFNADFFCGYSQAGTFKASSIKVAEAAKVIENSQRDINIAFVNELAVIFGKLGIDTREVLAAAGTKWNFLPFSPGLVGGHCIGVDPYYLAQKAQEVGYNPEIILAGRRLNDRMGGYVASEVIKLIIKKGGRVKGASILMMGITFKENCPDIRNTRVIDIVEELKDYGCYVDVYDPWAAPGEVSKEFGLSLMTSLEGDKKYDAAILAVAHNKFKSVNIKDALIDNGVLYDVKGVLDKEQVDGRL